MSSLNFTKDSQLVKDHVLLRNNGRMTLDEVPNLFNLKEVVQDVLTNQTNTNNN